MQLTHSYSAIKLYENCPLRYYRQRVIKDIVDNGGEASRYGERIHKRFELRLKDGTPLDAETAQYEPLCLAIERGLGGDGSLYVEKELTLNSDLQPTGWWDADAWLRSKLDVLTVRGPKAKVLDWKTGRRSMDSFQMGLFAVQVFKHYPEVAEVESALVWLKSNQIDRQIYLRENADQIWVEALTRIRRIYQSRVTGNWPARPSGLCGYCPAQSSCAFARTR